MFTNIYHIKHFHQAFISGIRSATKTHLFLAQPDIARVFQYKFIALFQYDNTIFSIKIRVDNAIRQRLSQCPVHRRIIDPKSSLHFKRHFDVFDDPVIYTKVKVK